MAVLDDQAAREAASDLAIEHTGILGMLCLAKERQLIQRIAPFMDALVAQGFWLSHKTRMDVLKLAGE